MVTLSELRDAWSKFVRVGGEAILEQVLLAASPFVYEICALNLRSEESAVEAHQQAYVEFLALCRAPDGPPENGILELLHLAKCCSDRMRDRGQWECEHLATAGEVELVEANSVSARDEALQHEEAYILEQLSSGLGAADRVLLELYKAGRTQADIARELKVSRSRVAHRLSEMTHELRDLAKRQRRTPGADQNRQNETRH